MTQSSDPDFQDHAESEREAEAGGRPEFEPGPMILGVPLDQVDALTLDGAHWLEVFGAIHLSAPIGGPVLTFRVAQTPGGKRRPLGVSQGDTITVLAVAVCGVRKKVPQGGSKRG